MLYKHHVTCEFKWGHWTWECVLTRRKNTFGHLKNQVVSMPKYFWWQPSTHQNLGKIVWQVFGHVDGRNPAPTLRMFYFLWGFICNRWLVSRISSINSRDNDSDNDGKFMEIYDFQDSGWWQVDQQKPLSFILSNIYHEYMDCTNGCIGQYGGNIWGTDC